MRLIDKRTLKSSLVVLAGVMIVAVLSVLIVESRTVKDEYYVAHAERTRTLQAIRNDITEVRERMERAFSAGTDLPLAVNLTFAQLLQNNRALQDSTEVRQLGTHVQTSLGNFSDTLHHFVAQSQIFTEKQNASITALQTLQNQSPDLVKALRENEYTSQAQLAFSLAIDLIEFATARNNEGVTPLYQRLATLQADPLLFAAAPDDAVAFLDAAKSIADNHTAAGAMLREIAATRVLPDLSALENAVLAANRNAVSRAERARLLLSICAVLLLIGAAFAVVRLQASYRELNLSNAGLEQANTRLEERVTERTQQLSKAYDDLKESQSQLIHAEKMSSLGQMVAGISHEINTPLWYLMSNAEVIQDRLDVVSEFSAIAQKMIDAVQARTDVSESIRAGLTDMNRLLKDGFNDDIEEAKELIQDSAHGLEELTNLAQGLKDFSRLDRAKQGQFDINDGLDKALLIASNKIKNRINVHKFYGEVPPIYCSPSQINQIFLNLLTNAADAIEHDGDLVLETWADDSNVGINISDNGAGIPADVLPSIRDPFFTTKDVGKGTGLGLSIVDQIVTKHGGEFHIDSEVGRGTTVTVVLPIVSTNVPVIDKQHTDGETAMVDVAAVVAGQNVNQQTGGVPRLLSA